MLWLLHERELAAARLYKKGACLHEAATSLASLVDIRYPTLFGVSALSASTRTLFQTPELPSVAKLHWQLPLKIQVFWTRCNSNCWFSLRPKLKKFIHKNRFTHLFLNNSARFSAENQELWQLTRCGLAITKLEPQQRKPFQVPVISEHECSMGKRKPGEISTDKRMVFS